MKDDWMDVARATAAQCWCDEETKSREMDTELCEAVARRIAMWIETAAHNANNVDYWRERAYKAEGFIQPSKYRSDMAGRKA